MPGRERRRWIPAACWTGLALAAFGWLGRGVRLMPLDHDEVQHAHVAWEMAQGRLPYRDFNENHPPFFWFAFAPVVKRLPESFDSLLVLRGVNLVFASAMLAALAWIAASGRPLPWGQAAAGLGLMFLQPLVVQALVEFRPDKLSACVVLAGLAVLARDALSGAVRGSIAGLLFGAGLAVDAKLGIAVVLGCVLELLAAGPAVRRGLAAGVVLGGLAGLAAAAGACLLGGIDLRMMWEQVFVYQSRFLQDFGAEGRLASVLLGHAGTQYGISALAWLLGLAGLYAVLAEGRWAAHRTILALSGFCLLQPVLVQFPFKQYSFTVYLCWAGAVSLGLERLARSRARPAVLCLVGLALLSAARFEWVRLAEARDRGWLKRDLEIGDWLLSAAPAGESVVAYPPRHPVFRRNASFYWIQTTLSASRSTEGVAASIPSMAGKFTEEAFLSQLRADPPGLIMLDFMEVGGRFGRALHAYLGERKGAYEPVRLGSKTVLLRRGGPIRGGGP